MVASGKTNELVEAEPVITPIKKEEPPQLIQRGGSGGNSAQGPPPKGNLLFRMAAVTFVSLLLTLNSTLFFPQSTTYLGLARPHFTGIYLGFFLFVERLMSPSIFATFHDLIWLILGWIAGVEFLFVTLGVKYTVQQSPIVWILAISLVLEFIIGVVLKIARKIPGVCT